MPVVKFSEEFRDEVVALMAELQDFEGVLSDDRPPGADVAGGHLSYLIALCSKSRGSVFVAVEDKKVAGFIVVIINREDNDDLHLYEEYKEYALITDLIVSNDYRKLGIAKKLLKKVESYSSALGIKVLKVTALCSNELARSFYEKSEFEKYEVTFKKNI
jgi:ribosomal protein S18 acetylase RimI-like enzyme